MELDHISDRDHRGNVRPEPLVTSADLVLGDRVTACLDSACHTMYREIFGGENDVDSDEVPRSCSLGDEVDLRGVRGDGLGDELAAVREQMFTNGVSHLGRLRGPAHGLGGVRPALGCEEIGIDERDPWSPSCQGETHESGPAGSVRADDEVEAAHRTVVVPSGQRSTKRPASSVTTVVTPSRASWPAYDVL